MTRSKLVILGLLATGIGLFFGLGLQHQLTLSHLQASRAELLALYAASPVRVLAGFFAAYVAVTALSLPGAVIMTLAAGALFGLGVGTVLVYLNDDYDGGATVFPESGLSVKGKRGDVLVFRNLDSAGRPDPATRHAGTPVTRGTKWLSSCWIRQRAYDSWSAR